MLVALTLAGLVALPEYEESMSDIVLAPAWDVKFREGKMFQRLACAECGTRFHFTDSPRATRVPRCPVCGGFGARPDAA